MLSLIHIRDAVRDVFDAQTNACSNDELSALQDKLNAIYDQHVKNYGLGIDVFPLDYMSNNRIIRQLRMKYAMLLRKLIVTSHSEIL